MAATNLLDRLAEEYEGNHPVEYRAQLAKLGKSIGNSVYSLGGGAKGVSARDIIRKDIKGNGVGVYPFDVLERQRNNKRKDDSMPWDYAIQSKDGGMLLDSFNGGTKADANEYMAQLKKKGIVPKDAKLVSNVSSSRQTAQQKRDFDEFKKAFEDVRAQRDYYNNEPRRVQGDGDILANGTVREKQNLINTGNMGPQLYHVDSWDKWLSAKKAAKEAGQNLGRLFAEQNQREKNVYGNISKGIGATTAPVPQGRYKYALGNQNHVYSASPDEPENDWMNLNPEYHGQPALTNSGHEIHWRKDGTPIIDAYTWTQIPNIEKIKKTGYLAVEGSDTKKYHPGTEGQWTAEVDNYPMDENYDNHVEIFKRGKNGETFNEELLHSRLPLNWFQKQPITHQGPRGWGVKVDVIHAKPSAPEVFWGEGEKRRSEQVATPAEFINHIPEDKMRKDWAPVWNKEMLPGSHPNKEDLGRTDEFIYDMTGRDPLIDRISVDEQKKNALKKANIDNYALRYALRNVDKADKTELQRNADNAFLEDYVSRTSGNRTPYDLAWQTKNVPQQGEGMIDRGNNTSLSQWNGIELPRTNAFTFQTYLDSKKLSDFLPLDSYERLLNNFYLNKFAGKYGHPANSLSMIRNIIPSPKKAEVLYKDYLDKIGMKHFSEIKKERDSFPGRSFFESPVTSHTMNRGPKKAFYKSELDDNKESRSLNAANKLFYSNPRAHAFVRKNVSSNPKFGKLENFSFDDWFEDYMHNDNFYKDFYKNDLTENKAVQNAIAMEKERVRPFIDEYLENIKKLPSDKELAKKAYERTKREFDNRLTMEEELDFLKRRQPYQQKADSLDKVIGHTIGRRIGADRAKRGKKIF